MKRVLCGAGSIFNPLMLIGLIGVSICWIVRMAEEVWQPKSAFTAYGWTALVATVAWAVLTSSGDRNNRRKRKLEAALLTSGSLGSGAIASTKQIWESPLLGDEGGIRLGYDKTGRLIRFTAKDGHGLIVAPTGEGKNRDWLTALTLDSDHASIIMIDLKGALTAICYDHRSKLGPFKILNPFETDEGIFPMTLPPSSMHNPMASLEPKKPGFTLACERIADGLAGDERPSGSENSAHFRDRSKGVLSGVTMHVAETYPKDLRHLGTVRNVLTSANGEDFWAFVKDAKERGSPYVQQKLSSFASEMARESKEVSDVISTAQRYTDFIGNETIEPILKGDGIGFAEAKQQVQTISVILPLEHLETCGKWFRLVIGSALHELWRRGRGRVPVILLMDEFIQYGSMEIIVSAMNAARNFGIILIPVVQQLSDLSALYKERFGSFVGGASWKIFGATDDTQTREYVEKLGGTKTVKVPSASFGESSTGSSSNISFGEHAVPVKPGYEVGLIPEDEFILKVRRMPLIEGKRKPYWECKDLDGRWSPDPYEA